MSEAVRDNAGRAGDDAFARERRRMVREQIARRGVRDPRVLAAMETVPRHLFLSGSTAAEAYGDHPVAIGSGQTASQPYIVAFMVEALDQGPGARVLEIGTGCGYQAAVLAEAGYRTWSVEIRPELAREAESTLQGLGYGVRVNVRCADGMLGWPEEAPFDGIICAAAPHAVPPALLEQLAPGGTMLLPVGRDAQVLWRYRRTPGGFAGEELFAVRFVPMIGEMDR